MADNQTFALRGWAMNVSEAGPCLMEFINCHEMSDVAQGFVILGVAVAVLSWCIIGCCCGRDGEPLDSGGWRKDEDGNSVRF